MGYRKEDFWNELAVGRELAATADIDVPQTRLGCHAFQPEFASPARFADPYHSELALFFAKLHFQQFAESDLPAKSLNERSGAANAGSPCVLHEWVCVRVQPPDADRKNCFDSRTAAAIHAAIVGILRKE